MKKQGTYMRAFPAFFHRKNIVSANPGYQFPGGKIDFP